MMAAAQRDPRHGRPRDPGAGADPAGTARVQRRCLVTRAPRPKAGLIRFAVSPDGNLLLDLGEKLPGRGLWLTAGRDIVAAALAKGLFSKGARAPVTAPPGLADEIERQLARRCLDLLGFARRAGEVTFGFERVKDWLQSGRAAVLVEALDGSEDGRSKLKPRPEMVRAICLTAEELGSIAGRDRVVHLALADGGLARKFLAEARRLAGFRIGASVPFARTPGAPEARQARPGRAERNEKPDAAVSPVLVDRK